MNKILEEYYVLSNGLKIPKFAIGTWQIEDEIVDGVVEYALEIGYPHVDTAIAYGNEVGVGRGIKKSGKKREEIFITTKIPAEIKNYEDAKRSIQESLERLGTDYLDLMIIHAPKPWSEMFDGKEERYYEGNLEVWRALEEAYNAGVLKSIGVSNFNVGDLQNIMDNGTIVPMVNQIQVHAGHTNIDIIEFCKEKNIIVMAYSPIGSGRLLSNEIIIEMASRYNVSPAQLCIRFTYQLGLIPLPKSTNNDRILQNTQIEFVISDEDMQTLLTMEE